MSMESSRLRNWFVAIAIIATCLMPVAVWIVSVGNPAHYFSQHVPPGQALYIFSKLFALIALALIWLQCMTALAKLAPALRGFFTLSRTQHVLLGVTSIVLIAAHVGAFIAASSVRTQHFALSLLLPRFDSGYFSSYVGIGAIAFWLALVVVTTGFMRNRGVRSSHWAHRAAFFVLGLSFLHGVSIGSETRYGPMAYVYAFIGLSFVTAVSSWIFSKTIRRPAFAEVRTESVAELRSVTSSAARTNCTDRN